MLPGPWTLDTDMLLALSTQKKKLFYWEVGFHFYGHSPRHEAAPTYALNKTYSDMHPNINSDNVFIPMKKM